jgi:hypothetical protein
MVPSRNSAEMGRGLMAALGLKGFRELSSYSEDPSGNYTEDPSALQPERLGVL